jgi:anti-sigma regulatory factor (Ser/Thr protein kinase)
MAQTKEVVKTAPREWRLGLTSDPAHLARVRHDLESFCQACGFDELARGEIVLCVNEALTNITRHAYHGAFDRPIELTAFFDRGVLRVRIRDWGTGKEPDIRPKAKDPLCPGGIGMVCLRQLLDNITFAPQPDGMILTMERKLNRDQGQSGHGSGLTRRE